MTLITAFKADFGFAICADAQESCEYGDGNVLKRSVQKIAPLKIGKYQIAIAGSGNTALIEAFIERARRSIERLEAMSCASDNPASVMQIHAALEDELAAFYANDVVLCPDEDKEMKLFIPACCPIAQQFALWVSQYSVLREANSIELNGWEHELYSETASRFSSSRMTVAQAALASIYTLTVAKSTSNYVGGPLSVVIVNKDGIWPVDADYVRTMEDRLVDYEAAVNRLFLSCADTTISVPDLEDGLEQFKKAVISLHREQIDQQAMKTSFQELFNNRGLRTLPNVPITFTPDRLIVPHDREEIEERKRQYQQMRKEAEEGTKRLYAQLEKEHPTQSSPQESKPTT
jgi:hypothetical protein